MAHLYNALSLTQPKSPARKRRQTIAEPAQALLRQVLQTSMALSVRDFDEFITPNRDDLTYIDPTMKSGEIQKMLAAEAARIRSELKDPKACRAEMRWRYLTVGHSKRHDISVFFLTRAQADGSPPETPIDPNDRDKYYKRVNLSELPYFHIGIDGQQYASQISGTAARSDVKFETTEINGESVSYPIVDLRYIASHWKSSKAGKAYLEAHPLVIAPPTGRRRARRATATKQKPVDTRPPPPTPPAPLAPTADKAERAAWRKAYRAYRIARSAYRRERPEELTSSSDANSAPASPTKRPVSAMSPASSPQPAKRAKATKAARPRSPRKRGANKIPGLRDREYPAASINTTFGLTVAQCENLGIAGKGHDDLQPADNRLFSRHLDVTDAAISLFYKRLRATDAPDDSPIHVLPVLSMVAALNWGRSPFTSQFVKLLKKHDVPADTTLRDFVKLPAVVRTIQEESMRFTDCVQLVEKLAAETATTTAPLAVSWCGSCDPLL